MEPHLFNEEILCGRPTQLVSLFSDWFSVVATMSAGSLARLAAVPVTDTFTPQSLQLKYWIKAHWDAV